MAAICDSHDQELQKVKSEIRSLLISNPSKSVQLTQFLKEFRKNIGKTLPFEDFSYKTPLQFLSTLNDVVRIIDAADGPRLEPVSNELSSHISQMVESQKKIVNRRPAYRNMTYHPPASSFVPPQPRVGSYLRSPPVPLMQQPYTQMFSHPADWRHPQTYPAFGFAVPQYNYSVGIQHYPAAQPSRFPRAAPHTHSASPSGGKGVNNDSVGNRNTPTKATKIEVGDPDEDRNEIPDTEPKSSSNLISQIVEDTSADHHSVIQNKPDTYKDTYKVPDFVVDPPDSTSDAKVVDFASLDVQSSGQEDQNLSSPGSSESSKRSDNDGDSGNLNSNVKSKIWAVLEKHTNGVPSSSFMGLYKSLHSCPLDFASLGFSSLKEMVLKNDDIFSFEKTKVCDDWILYDARLKPKRRQSQVPSNKWIPHNVVDSLAALARKYRDGIDADEILLRYKDEYQTEIDPRILGFDSVYSFLENCKSISVRKYGDKGMVYPKDWVSNSRDTSDTPADIKEPALPPSEDMKFLWKDYFKEYECDPSFKFKPVVIPEDKVLQVKIVDLHSPALMWIQFLDDIKSLNLMMYQLNSHYDTEQREYSIPENFVLPGLAVASMFGGTWHRATILSVNGLHAEVFYIDYGTTCTANTSELRKLDRRFGKDRVYAIKASLFCLVPYSGDEWSAESCNFIYSLYADKILFAEICSVNYQEPFVEVIFYDTSKNNTEININDLLVSKKHARYMTNPASILNERSITRFYKFLPRWFSTSERSNDDVGLCCKNLLLCTSADSVPINSDAIPCCKLHCIQTMCRANSAAMALVWENAVREEEERIVNNVLRQVEDSLKEWGWESCMTTTLCCVNDVLQAEPARINGHGVDVVTANPIKTERPVQSEDSYARFQSQLDTQPQKKNNISKPNNNLSESKSLSMSGLHHPRTSGNRNILDKKNHTRFTKRPRLLYPRAIRYVDSMFNATALTLIFFNGEIRVCLSQVFQLTKLPSMLAKKRLEIADVKADFIVASRSHYPDLYNDLHDLELINPEGDPILVLLSDAPKIIRAVDPLGQYQDTFENLAKEVAPLLDELMEPTATDSN